MRQQHGPAFGPYYQTDVDVTVMKRQLLSGAFPGVPTAAPVATSPEDAADFWSPPKPLRGLLPLADGPSRTRTWTWTPEVPCQARGLQPRRTSNFRWINESSMGIVPHRSSNKSVFLDWGQSCWRPQDFMSFFTGHY